MLELLFCAAGIAAPARPAPAMTADCPTHCPAEFLEFLADWDAAEAGLIDQASPPAGAAPAAEATASRPPSREAAP